MKMKITLGGTRASLGAVGIVAWLLVILALVVGYVHNIIDVVHLALSNSPVTVLMLMRVVGIFAMPLGGILGWF